jgi:hypothetical protein
MNLSNKIKEEACKVYSAEFEKKKIEFDEKRQFIFEIKELGKIIYNNIRYIGEHFFFSFLFYRQYSIYRCSDCLYWELRGQFFLKKIYTIITIQIVKNSYIFSVNYTNDSNDLLAAYQLHKKTSDLSMESMEEMFLDICRSLAKVKAAIRLFL